MASELSAVTYICDQSGLRDRLAHKKMFGEYALYLHGKVVAFVCDNRLYLKPTVEGRAVLGAPREAPPYPGAKNCFLLDAELDDRELLRRAIEATADALPAPKPKKPKARRAAPSPAVQRGT